LENAMSDHQEALRTIRGMALAAAAAYQGTEGVRTQVELNDDFDPPELLKLRIFIGERSTVVAISGPDVARVRSDEAVRRKVDRLIGVAVAGIAR
jgi:hypothetical protein